MDGCVIVLGGTIGKADRLAAGIVEKNVKIPEGASSGLREFDDKAGGTVKSLREA